MGGKDGMRDPRFKVMHDDEERSLITRSSDGQLLFLANMAAKMNFKSLLGSRIAEVHNGSSLFTGEFITALPYSLERLGRAKAIFGGG